MALEAGVLAGVLAGVILEVRPLITWHTGHFLVSLAYVFLSLSQTGLNFSIPLFQPL